MNFLKKFENILEQVDSQAAKQIEQLKSPTSNKEKEREEGSYSREGSGQDIPSIDSLLSDFDFSSTESAFEIEGEGEKKKRRRKVRKNHSAGSSSHQPPSTTSSPPSLLPPSSTSLSDLSSSLHINHTNNNITNNNNNENDQMIKGNDGSDDNNTNYNNDNNNKDDDDDDEGEEEEEEEGGEEERLRVENELLKSKIKAIEGKAKALAAQYTKLHSSHLSLTTSHTTLLSQRDGNGKDLKRMSMQIAEYQKAIESKDSLLASLQLKLQQKIDEVQLIKDQLSHSDLQLIQFQSAHKESEGTKRKIFEEIEEKKREVEEELAREREENGRNREGMERRIKELEEQIGEFAGTIQRTQEELKRSQSQAAGNQKDITRYEKDIQILRNELRIYKMKAASVLQQKDTEILTLSSSSSLSPATSSSDLKSSLSKSGDGSGDAREIIDRLEKENAMRLEEIHDLRCRLDDLSLSLIESESLWNDERKSLDESISHLSSSLLSERSHSQLLLADLHSRSLELNAAKDLADIMEKKWKKEMEEKDREITRLVEKVKGKSTAVNNEHELEERLQQMSDTIIAKQSLIDTLSSENSALLLQLRSSSPSSYSYPPIKPSKRSADHHHHHRLNDNNKDIYDDDDEEAMIIRRRYEEEDKGNARMTSLLTLFPSLASSPSPLSRPLLLFSSFLDHLSLRAASVLRLYPSIRLLTILYLALLHLWLFSFILKSSGEIETLPDVPQ